MLQALEEAREAGDRWERQFQEALGQLERLKDLLEESALWQAGAGEPGVSSATSGRARAGGEGESSGLVERTEQAVAVPYSSTSAKDGHLAALEQRCVQVTRTLPGDR